MKATLTLCALLVLSLASTAHAWDPFVKENGNVKKGNERMTGEDPSGALSFYDQAARELPNEPGVHLNRGLALLASGEHEKARKAFIAATDPRDSEDGPPIDHKQIRADAYYNAGLSYFQEGDAKAADEDHKAAQTHFKEAIDVLKRSLREKPGNRDAAWNLELALRRLSEEKEKQEEKDKQEQEEKDKQEQEEKDKQEQEEKDKQEQDQQDQDQQDQDQQDQDQQDSDEQKQDGDQKEEEEEKKGEGEEEEQEGTKPEPEEQEPGDEGQPEEQQEPEQQEQEGLPRDVERVLDSLQDSEENLERHRARKRAARERRQPIKDW